MTLLIIIFILIILLKAYGLPIRLFNFHKGTMMEYNYYLDFKELNHLIPFSSSRLIAK